MFKRILAIFLLAGTVLVACGGEPEVSSQVPPETTSKMTSRPVDTEELRKERMVRAADYRAKSPARVARPGPKKLRLARVGVFDEPVWVEEGPDAIYIVEKGGRIIRRDGVSERVWLDISGRVRNSGEAGLLGMALAPDFAQSGLFYVYYTARSGRQIVAEGTSRGQPRLLRTVLRMEDPAENHNGGQISFGPGGLYIATGDGGGSGDPERAAQNKRSLLGKILRIDPGRGQPYAIPSDNPFARGGGRPEIFSLGLRNPWRFSFGAGRLWVADVGQDRQEEISAPRLSRARGGNFGWSAWEGNLPFNSDQSAPRAIRPVFVYGRERGCSVTGGYWTRRLGRIQNRYIYGDFCSGQIRSFRLRGGRARGDRSEGVRVPSLASFARGPSGKTWAISLRGSVWRLLG